MTASRYTLAAIIWGTNIALNFTGNLSSTNGSMDGNPYSLILLMVAAVIIIIWPRPQLPIVPDVPVGRFRRYVAATIDILIALYVFFAILFPLTYLLEWIATGSWQWSWQRDSFEPRDIIGFLAFFLAFYGMYQYFWRHLQSGKPTVGQFVMGYRIIELEDAKLRQRLHSGIVALWLWPLALFKTYDKAGITYWDRDTNTRAVSTRAP